MWVGGSLFNISISTKFMQVAMNGRNMTEKDIFNAKLVHKVHNVQIINKNINLTTIMDDHA